MEYERSTNLYFYLLFFRVFRDILFRTAEYTKKFLIFFWLLFLGAVPYIEAIFMDDMIQTRERLMLSDFKLFKAYATTVIKINCSELLCLNPVKLLNGKPSCLHHLIVLVFPINSHTS